jgi:D-sedoheptulose 7-phosphate isomerase
MSKFNITAIMHCPMKLANDEKSIFAATNYMMKVFDIINASISTKQKLIADQEMLDKVEAAARTITNAYQQGKKVLFCGNGGSAADAQHLAAEFSGRFYLNRRALPAEALHVNTSYLTAVANDYSYDVVYSRLVDGIGHEGDVLFGISTSGNSTNIVNAMIKAKEIGMITIGFTGEHGGIMRDHSDFLFNMPSTDTPRIQECHILIGHIICQLVEAYYFAHEN